MKIRRRAAGPPGMMLVSMSDIAFQLIFFFMVAGSFVKNDALKVELPNNDPSQAQEQDEQLTLQASQTALALNGTETTMDSLQAELESRLAGKPEGAARTVILMTSDDITWQRLSDLRYIVMSAGGVVGQMYETEE